MERKRYVRKNQSLSELVSKIKLWPSRNGILHGVKEIRAHGELLVITTHCGNEFVVNDSRHSRSARWLRNNFTHKICPECNIPEWKIEKYSKTIFN